MQKHLAIIGGTGLYQLDSLEHIKQHEVQTPFGRTSAPIIEGRIDNQKILFLPRHGLNHEFLPHEVNYRANIWALKSLGAHTILSISATGSLREDFQPGDLVLTAQYFDHTRGKRAYSFFGEGVAGHVMSAKPTCPALRDDILKAAGDIHKDAIYACVEGPRLGTQAESFFLKNSVKADLVGMTNVPEVFLAREAQMGYVTLAIITDYDCWMEDETKHADIEDIFKTYGQSIGKVKNIIETVCKNGISETPDWIRSAIKYSVLTPEESLTNKQKDWLSVLRA